MYTLYYTTRSYTTESTALIPRIALEEIGAGYDVAEVELTPAPPEWYLAINPRGKIPSLIERRPGRQPDAVVFPSSAILLYLADNHPDAALFPADDVERAHGYRTLLDMAELVQSAFVMFFYPERFSTNEDHAANIRARAVEWLARYWEDIDSSLQQGPYLVSNSYTICDIYMYVLARWYVDVCHRVESGSLPAIRDLRHVAAACSLAESRSAVARALAADDIGFIAKDVR